MEHVLQKAGLWKRIAAGILDFILLLTLAVGFAAGFSWVIGYDTHSRDLEQMYQTLEQRYGEGLQVSQEDYDAMSDQEQQQMQEDAQLFNEKTIYVINLQLLITTVGVFLAIGVIEVAIPLILGHGRTVGKKVFSLCLVRTDAVKLNGLQLITRAFLGKFAVGIMILVYTGLMLFWGTANLFTLLLALAVIAGQVICFMATRHNALLHDLMAGTAVVDYASQRIFRTTEELVAYQKQIAAERAARQSY